MGSETDTNQPQVRRLTDVFKNQYNFNVHHGLLNQRYARHQLNRHFAEFLIEEDGENVLLIIYYAGHGIDEEDEGFILAG